MKDELYNKEPDFVLGKIWQDLFKRIGHLQYHIKTIFLGSIVCALSGLALSFIKHKTYTAKVNFVIEENKQNAGGIFSALAGQIGLDMNSLSNSAGILAGDNVLELLKSPTLLKKVLLTSMPEDSIHSIAWEYSKSYGYANGFSKMTGSEDFSSHSPKQIICLFPYVWKIVYCKSSVKGYLKKSSMFTSQIKS